MTVAIALLSPDGVYGVKGVLGMLRGLRMKTTLEGVLAVEEVAEL
jgi:hypothetical protein